MAKKRKKAGRTTRRRRSRVSGFSTAGVMNVITDQVLPGVAGFALGNILDKQLTFLANNQQTAQLLKVGLGLAAASMTKGMVASIGAGLATNGAYDLVAPQLEKSGILGIGSGMQLPSPGHRLAGVQGTPEGIVLQ